MYMHNTQYLQLVRTHLKPILIVVTLIVVTVLYGCVYYRNIHTNLSQDPTPDEFWLHFPGAESTSSGIHFKPLGRVIIHQDGSAGQPHPPVNLAGSHVEVTGDFRVTATLVDIDKQASLRLYAGVPIVYDQWRYETPSVSIDVEQNLITMRVWDGSSSHSIDMRTYPVSLGSQTTISIEHIHDHINIVLNNRLLGSIPDHDIFESGNIWFGADSPELSTGWTLIAFNVRPVGNGSVEIIPAPSLVIDHDEESSLRNLADIHPRKLKIGAAIAVGPLVTHESYRIVALGQFSMMTPENSMKPQFIHPQPDVYVFEEADQLVLAAEKNVMMVHGHTLLYDKSTPQWMIDTPESQRKEVMLDHIEHIVEHYKGKVSGWDVVNEPLSKKHALYADGGTGLEPNIWFEAMGEEYIDLAFAAAHQADPSAQLYLNDFGLERDGERWDALLRLVKRLIHRGVPIHGVGFQSHIYSDGDYIDANELTKHMEILATLGLSTRISEIDVTGDDPDEQINQYVIALDVCLQASNCTSYTTWGITDLYGSTTRSDRYPLVYGTSLLWDTDMKTKPAYGALQNRLQVVD